MDLFTTITDKNLKFYLPLLSNYVIEASEFDNNIRLLGIEHDHIAAGSAAVRIIGNEVELIWYYIAEQFREMGLGTEMFDELIMTFCEQEYERFSVILPPKVSRAQKSLLNGYPFKYTEADEGNIYTTIGKLKKIDKLGGGAKKSVPLNELTSKKLNGLCNSIVSNNSNYVSMPIKVNDYLSDISSVYMDKDEAQGVLLVQKETEAVRVSFIYSESKNPLSLLDMMRHSVNEATKVYSDDTVVEMNMLSPELTRFTESLLSEAVEKSQRAELDLSVLNGITDSTDDVFSLYAESNIL